VASRAILRDTRSGDKMAEAMSYIAATMGIAPVVAPIVGGAVDANFGFQWIFIVTAVLGLVVFLGMLVHMTETLNRDYPTPRWGQWLSAYGMLLCSRSFMGYTLVFGFVQGSFFAFIAIGAVYFANQYGIGSSSFGTLWGILAVTYIIGASLGARTTRLIGSHRVVSTAVLIGLVAGSTLPLFSLSTEPSLVQLLLPMGALMMVSGATTPGAMAGAISAHPEIAGTASGLSSALGLLVGGGFTVIAGLIYRGAFFPVALLMFAACIATALSCWLAQSAGATRDQKAT